MINEALKGITIGFVIILIGIACAKLFGGDSRLWAASLGLVFFVLVEVEQ